MGVLEPQKHLEFACGFDLDLLTCVPRPTTSKLESWELCKTTYLRWTSYHIVAREVNHLETEEEIWSIERYTHLKGIHYVRWLKCDWSVNGTLGTALERWDYWSLLHKETAVGWAKKTARRKPHEVGRLRGSTRIMDQVLGFCFLRKDAGTKIGGEYIGNGSIKRWNWWPDGSSTFEARRNVGEVVETRCGE